MISPLRSFSKMVAFAAMALALTASAARAEFVTALGSSVGANNATIVNALVTFDTNSPQATSGPIAVTGVDGRLLDIDYRPAGGALIGLGLGANNVASLYSINAATGAASLISTISTALSGTQFAIDFNPTVDRLRIVSNAGQNLRVNVDTGAAITDGTLTATGIVGAAYTNNFAGATSTTLYDLSYSNNLFTLNTQTPANDGTIQAVGSTGISSPTSLNGFDISGTGVAYVATNTTSGLAGNSVNLSTINLANGNISSLSPVGVANFQVRGIAAAAVPEPASVGMLALGLAGLGLVARRSR